jgi:hypothetical protein
MADTSGGERLTRRQIAGEYSAGIFGLRARGRRRQLRAQIDEELTARALRAARRGRMDQFAELSRMSGGLPDLQSGGAPEAGRDTSHEYKLDGWRVFITVLLILALFTIMALIVSKSLATSTATPYVSLLSGLAGIALGWMFASGGGPRQRSISVNSRPDSPPAQPQAAPRASKG